MKKVTRDELGISLISLVVTIIVILILVAITIYSGGDVVKSSKFAKYETEFKIMQIEVNDLYSKYKSGTDDEKNEIINYGEIITTELKQKDGYKYIEENKQEELDGYRYFSQNTIKGLKVEGVEEDFFVNILTRSVISANGFTYEGNTYYEAKQMSDGLYNPEYDDVSTENVPTFDVSYEKLQNGKYRVTISNIQYNGNINIWKVKYRNINDSNWNTTEEMSFDVNNEGTYKVKIYNNNIEKEEEIIIEKEKYYYNESTGEVNLIDIQTELPTTFDEAYLIYNETRLDISENGINQNSPSSSFISAFKLYYNYSIPDGTYECIIVKEEKEYKGNITIDHTAFEN